MYCTQELRICEKSDYFLFKKKCNSTQSDQFWSAYLAQNGSET